jgi:hypothetical protein
MLYKQVWKQRPIRMSDELWIELKKLAAQKKIPMSELVRQIIIKHLEVSASNQYSLGSGGIPNDIPMVDPGKDSIGKDRLGRLGKVSEENGYKKFRETGKDLFKRI